MIKYIIKGEDYNHCEVIIRQHKLNKGECIFSTPSTQHMVSDKIRGLRNLIVVDENKMSEIGSVSLFMYKMGLEIDIYDKEIQLNKLLESKYPILKNTLDILDMEYDSSKFAVSRLEKKLEDRNLALILVKQGTNLDVIIDVLMFIHKELKKGKRIYYDNIISLCNILSKLEPTKKDQKSIENIINNQIRMEGV